MTEVEKRQHRCCFTGHRPEKLTKTEREIKADLNAEIHLAIQAGFYVFITGMARGVDLWAAEIVLELRKKNKNLKLICAVPYEGFEDGWSQRWRQAYRDVLDEADFVRVIDRGYSPRVFQTRNEWMVDHAARVIAVFNGEAGGTRNTIGYAERRNVPVQLIKG